MRQFRKRMLANGLAMTLVLSSLSITNVSAIEKEVVDFSDVNGHWAEKYIKDFVNKEYIQGYGDGTFRPENNVTRAEFVRIVNMAFGFTQKGNEKFSDVNESDWYYDEVLKAVKQGYIQGYGDGTFRPNDKITREEACKIIGAILKASGDGRTKFKDEKEISDWAIKYVDGLVDMGIIHGYEDNTFKPKNNATRAESVKTLHGAKEKYKPDGGIPPVINPTPPPKPEPEDDLLDPENPKWNIDSDKDGLTDAEEELIGTNPNKIDTDGDGLNDKFELESGLDATKKDSDNNGILDLEEDLDKDRLKNKDEQKHNTSSIIEDTDGDGLSDYEEIYNYKTNPLKEDTDEDKILDGKEIELGTNPLKNDTNGNGINDGDEKYKVDIETPVSDKDKNVDVSISGSIAGSNIENLYIINMEGTHEFINSDNPGYISAPFRVGNDKESSTENVDINFALSEEVAKNNIGDEFALYKYNKEKQVLEIASEPQKISYKKGKIFEFTDENVKLGEEYIEYILLNKTKWDEAWSKEIIDPGNESGLLDIVLTIDSSGSMYSNDPNDLRKQESIDFINKLEGENRAAVVDFDSYAKVYQGLTTDKDLLQSAINKVNSSGGTNISRGLRAAIDELDPSKEAQTDVDYDKYTTYDDGEENQNNDDLKKIKDIDYIKNLSTIEEISNQIDPSGRNKFIMLLTDGESTIDHSLIEEVKAKNIKVYTIGLGSGIDSEALENISTETGGKYQYGETAEDFEEIFKELEDGTINLIQDTDGDGIPDYFEENMRLVGGIFIKLDPKNRDTDDDGIYDGEEITGKKNPTPEDFHNMYIKDQKAFEYYSRPDLKDTDDDGIHDNDDKDPNTITITPSLLFKAADLSYEVTSDDKKTDNNDGLVQNVDFQNSSLGQKNIDDIGPWTIIESYDPDDFGAVILKRGSKIIISYTGTGDNDGTIKDDWFEEHVGTFIKGASWQAGEARRIVNLVEKYNKGCDVYISGHSLGGYLSQVAGYHINYKKSNPKIDLKEIITFNSEPILRPSYLHPDFVGRNHNIEKLGYINGDRYIHNYHIKNDPLLNLNNLYGGQFAGKSKKIFDLGYNFTQIGAAHSRVNFYNDKVMDSITLK